MSNPFTTEWLDASVSAFYASLLPRGERSTIAVTVLGGPEGDVSTVWRFADGELGATIDQDADADVVVTLPWSDVGAVVDGSLEPSVAYMQGRLKGSGDMTLLLRLLRASETPAFATWRDALAGAR